MPCGRPAHHLRQQPERPSQASVWPLSCLQRAAANGRDFLFAVSADSSHSSRRALNGRSSRRRAQRPDPELTAGAERSGHPRCILSEMTVLRWLKIGAMRTFKLLQQTTDAFDLSYRRVEYMHLRILDDHANQPVAPLSRCTEATLYSPALRSHSIKHTRVSVASSVSMLRNDGSRNSSPISS